MNKLSYFLIISAVLIVAGCTSKYTREWVEGANHFQASNCHSLVVKSQYEECMGRVTESYEVYKHKRKDSIELE